MSLYNYLLPLLVLFLLLDNSCLFFCSLKILIAEACSRANIVARPRWQSGLGLKWFLLCQIASSGLLPPGPPTLSAYKYRMLWELSSSELDSSRITPHQCSEQLQSCFWPIFSPNWSTLYSRLTSWAEALIPLLGGDVLFQLSKSKLGDIHQGWLCGDECRQYYPDLLVFLMFDDAPWPWLTWTLSFWVFFVRMACQWLRWKRETSVCINNSRQPLLSLKSFPGDTVREGNGTPLQYSRLENPMDRGA